MNPFAEPYRILTKIYSEGAHLKIALSELPVGEHGRTVRLVYATLENNGYLDLCVKKYAAKPPKPAVKLLLKLALAGFLYGGIPRYTCADEIVKLATELGKGGAAGFLNAVVRRFSADEVAIPAGEEGLAVRSNFPLFAVREIQKEYGDRAERILTAKSAGVSVRFERNEENYLSRPHIETPFEHLYLFPRFARDEGFARGDYTFQSVGSVAICKAVEPCERLLDACAAPGGKSALLSKTCKNVVACDVHPHRVSLIESYFRRMGVKNAAALKKDGAVFDPAWEGAFDGVLVDAPCSGLGTVAENPDLPLRKEEGGMSELNALQFNILCNCARYVSPRGMLYYSTCSILGRENDGVANSFLSARPDFECVLRESPLPHEKTAFGMQFLPDEAYGAGFYIAAFRRKP